jgi:two-component system, OmpR family, sensor histidine kinase SenX3
MSLWSRRPDRVTLLATGALLVLLVALGMLQFHWIGEVSRAARERLRSRLEADAQRFSEELDRELSRAFMAFVQHSTEGDPHTRLAEQMRRWQAAAPYPGLVRGLFLARPDGSGRWTVERLEATGRFVPSGWPVEVAALGRRLSTPAQVSVSDIAASGRPESAAPDAAETALPLIDGSAPALVLPLAPPFHPMVPDGPGPTEVRLPEPGFVLIQLDREVLARTLLPELAERFFDVSREPHVLLAVAGPGGQLIYRSEPKLAPARYLPGDLAVPLLGMRGLGRLHGLTPGPLPRHDAAPRERHNHFRIIVPLRVLLHGRPAPVTAGAWQLVVTHRAGSLEAAVANVRRHNLAVSSGILVLLAASLAVLTVSARRARDLARRQIELVAGITHEINTPLAAIRSAAQNLADGVVAEPAQVRRYGTLLDREGARLAGLVTQALELAGIRSGSRVHNPEPVALAEVVDEVLADLSWPLAERGLTGEQVEVALPPDLPPVLADRPALRRALANLIDNAVKYGGEGGWLGIRGRRGPGKTVEVTVADRGPGIAAADRPHLFEPFYRGRAVAPGEVPGSGLGLALVRQIAEAHRGSVLFEPGPDGRGSAFTLRLPAAPAPPATAAPSPPPSSPPSPNTAGEPA